MSISMRWGWMAACLLCAGCAASPGTPASREIDAAVWQNFDDDKVAVMSAIAVRPALSDAEQVYLVHTAVHRLSSTDDRVRVLNKLVENPNFSAQAQDAMLKEWTWIGSDREDLANKLHERAVRKTTTQPATGGK